MSYSLFFIGKYIAQMMLTEKLLTLDKEHLTLEHLTLDKGYLTKDKTIHGTRKV
ncbi:MAG: hypothetical protein PUP91_14775 [Rhizonema sp. PD37]|nr:hypothetical protein [Rhizonema sp. PD37]